MAFEAVLDPDRWAPDGSRTYHVGVDLGTATIVTAVVDEAGTPAGGMLSRSGSSIRDGLVLDYMGAVAIVQRHVQTLKNAGFSFTHGAAAYPPGTTGKNAQAFANVLTAADIEVAGLVDEPSAAALTLDIEDGAVVDIGGGTTGISVLEGRRVVYTADEPTGGVHVDLVLAPAHACRGWVRRAGSPRGGRWPGGGSYDCGLMIADCGLKRRLEKFDLFKIHNPKSEIRN